MVSLPLFLLEEFDNFPPEEEESLGGFAGFIARTPPPFPPCSFLGEWCVLSDAMIDVFNARNTCLKSCFLGKSAVCFEKKWHKERRRERKTSTWWSIKFYIFCSFLVFLFLNFEFCARTRVTTNSSVLIETRNCFTRNTRTISRGKLLFRKREEDDEEEEEDADEYLGYTRDNKNNSALLIFSRRRRRRRI